MAPPRPGTPEGVTAASSAIIPWAPLAAQLPVAQLPVAQYPAVTQRLAAAQNPAAQNPMVTQHLVMTQRPAAAWRSVAAQRHAAYPATAKRKAPAWPAKPYQIYDSVTPSAIPGGRRVAVYANGPYSASAAAVAGRSHVLWIDTNGSDPQANVLDVEPGDATPYDAGRWARARLSAHPASVAILYTMRSEWQAVKDNVATLPAWMRTRVRYWIADPTGRNHVVPGASATQWYWGHGYDITTANPNFER